MFSGNAPPQMDGVGDHTASLMRELKRQRPDWRWIWVSRRPGRVRSPLTYVYGVPVIRPNAFLNERGIRLMARVVRSLGPDLVHIQDQIHTLHQSDAAVRVAEAVAPRPVVTSLHEFHIELPTVRHTIDVVQRSTTVIAHDRRNAERCRDHAGREVDHLWWTVNTVPPADPSWGVKVVPGRITTFGFLNALKSLGAVYDAIELLRPEFPELTFEVIGPFDPTTNADHAALARRLSADWVSFPGGFPVQDRRLRTRLAQSNMMVLPFSDGASVRRSSLKVGWAFGLPVLTTPPPHEEPAIRDEQNCLLVHDMEPTSWAGAIRRVLTEPDLADRLRAGSLEAERQQSAEVLARKHIELYEQLLSR